MGKPVPANKRQPGPHGRTEHPLYETMYVLCPSARYVGGTSIYLCECAHPRECLGARAAKVQAAAERDTHARNQPLIIRNTLHIEEVNGALLLFGRCLRGDFLRLGAVKDGVRPRVQQEELAEVFDFKMLDRPGFMDALIERMHEKHPDLKWEVTPAAPEPAETLAQYELKDRREVYGNDSRAINRHSVRQYEYQGATYVLEKILDVLPPYYELYLSREDRALMPVSVFVYGEIRWGNGLTWSQAEAKALAALRGLHAQPARKGIPASSYFSSKHVGRPVHIDSAASRALPRLTPRAPRALEYGETLHPEDLVLGDTNRILDLRDEPYRLLQNSQDVYEVLEDIGQTKLMAEYDGLLVRDNEDSDAPPAEVWAFNGTPRHEKQAELIYMARLDARLPQNRMPDSLLAAPSVGPFMGVSLIKLKFLGNGRHFKVLAYNAYNADGLIDKQPGVAVLDDDRRQVVCDGIQCGCGAAEGVNMLLGMADADFVKFVNEHPRHRYEI